MSRRFLNEEETENLSKSLPMITDFNIFSISSYEELPDYSPRFNAIKLQLKTQFISFELILIKSLLRNFFYRAYLFLRVWIRFDRDIDILL